MPLRNYSLTTAAANNNNNKEEEEEQFLFQRLSIAVQRFNAILLHESFGSDVDLDL